jgi:hypothetical protein
MSRLARVKTYDGSTGILFDVDEEMVFVFGTTVSGSYGVDDLVRFTVQGVGTTASGTNIELVI